MKNNMIKVLLITTMIFSVGCTNSSNNTIEDNTYTQENTNKDLKINNEEMYKLHEELLPKVKQLYLDKGFVVDEKNYSDGNYDGVTDLRGNGTNEISEYSTVSYGMVFDSTNNVQYIGSTLSMNVDENLFKDNEFKLENTMFYEISKIMIEENIDYTEINKQVNKAISNKDYKKINNKYGTIGIDIVVSPEQIKYSIAIFPK